MRLLRSLYGLKQASRTWHYHLVRGMLRLDFEQCKFDSCAFRLTMVVVVHVDGVFSIGTKSRFKQFGADLNTGELRWYAGLRFVRDKSAGTVTISQQAVAEQVVAKFGVTKNKDTPMVIGLKLEEFDPEEPNVDNPFRSLVGHLMWMAKNTRPDIFNAVRAVARYTHAPKEVLSGCMCVVLVVLASHSRGVAV